MMVEISRQANGNQKVSLSQVAKTTDISRRYLEQLAIVLKNASLIKGVSGKGGGYMLSKPANKIRIGEIVEAAIGPVNIVDCVLQPELCLQADTCVCRPIYQNINERITGVLHDFSLADLALQSHKGKRPSKKKVK
jgi:Rrf2 family protein